MELFTGREYLEIDIANHFGLDKYGWHERLLWVAESFYDLEKLVADADEPYLMAKAVMAYREVLAGNATGHLVGLDCTASGLQIMAALSGCRTTGSKVNLIGHRRKDVYADLAEIMNRQLSEQDKVIRADVKYPLMTH